MSDANALSFMGGLAGSVFDQRNAFGQNVSQGMMGCYENWAYQPATDSYLNAYGQQMSALQMQAQQQMALQATFGLAIMTMRNAVTISDGCEPPAPRRLQAQLRSSVIARMGFGGRRAPR